jgi:hypothetical protein
MPVNADKSTRVLKDPVTGELLSVPAAEADDRASREGLEYATLKEIESFNEREKYGSAGETALGALELAGEAATLGLYQGDEARRRVLRREHPGLAFAAEAAGTVGAGAAAAAATGGAAGALGVAGRAARAASIVAEGGVSGFSQEQIQAREEGRDIDIGNVLLYGVGGEIAGRMIPKAAGAGLRRLAGRGEDAVAGAADNVLVRAEQRATQSGTDLAEAAPGPERDRFLRDNARDLSNQGAERAAKAMDRANRAFQDLGDVSKKRRKVANLVSKEHVGQDKWMADQLDRFQAARDEVGAFAETPGLAGMVKKLSKFLDEAEEKMTGSRKAADRFIAADEGKRALQRFHVALGRSRMNAQDAVFHDQVMSVVDSLQEGLRRGLEDESLWGRAAAFQKDVNAAWHDKWFKGAMLTESDLARITGKEFDAKPVIEFDPAKVRSFLEKDRVGRGISQDSLERVLEGYEQMAEAHAKWGITDEKSLSKLREDVAQVRKAVQDADEIQAAKPRADKADAAEAASDQIAAAVPVVGPAYVAAKRMLRNINTAGRAHVRTSANLMVNGLRKAGRAADAAGEVGAPAATVALGHMAERKGTDERFKGTYPTMTQAFLAKREQVQTAMQEPDTFVDAIAQSFGDLPEAFPDVHFRLVERMTQAFHYLAQNMPPGVENSLMSKHSTPPDVQAIRQWARLWEAVMDPGAVIQDFATMQATPEQARAIKAVHPDIFEQLQADALNAIVDAPRLPPYERIRYLSQMFDLGAALGGVWRPSVAQNIRSSLQAAPPTGEGLPNPKMENFTGPTNPRGIASISAGPTFGQA